MTKIDKIICDQCNKELENIECHVNQVKFVLIEKMDGGKIFDFCDVECLKGFLIDHEFEERFHKYKEKLK